MTWTDEELVAKSISGDADSFNELILRWERPIYALAYRTIGREEDARDVCQETFLRAFRALPGFRGQAKFSSWLYRIALNLCRDWIRRERRAPVVQPPEDVDLIELAAAAEPSESIEDLVARKDLSRLVERAMALLPEEQRTAIVLKEYHGLTFQEIADLVGCPLSTVKTRLYQGLTVLRRELAKNQRPRARTMTDILWDIPIATKRSSRFCMTSIEPGERRDFNAHLLTCTVCRDEVAGLRAVRTQLARWEPPAFTSLQSPVPATSRPAWWQAVPASKATNEAAKRIAGGNCLPPRGAARRLGPATEGS